MSTRLTTLAALAALLVGCMPPRAVGHFGDEAFYHARDHYRVRYVPHGPRYALVPGGWTLESYRFDQEGHPLGASTDPAFVQTYDRIALTRRGRPHPITAERFDLFFREQGGDGTMWARTMPLDGWWEGLDIAFLMRLAVAHLGQDPAAPDLLGTDGYRSLSNVVSDRPARVDGQRAHAVTFDVMMRAGETVTQRRVTVVGLEVQGRTWRQGRVRRPMLLVFGYASSPAEHFARRRAFESLVSRVDLH